MPAFSVTIVRQNGRTNPELIEAPTEAAAVADAENRGLRVSGAPTPIGAGRPAAVAGTDGVTIHPILARCQSAGFALVLLGVLFVPFTPAGIVLGLIGGGRHVIRTVVLGFAVLIAYAVMLAVILSGK
jgi:hypothetical protein